MNRNYYAVSAGLLMAVVVSACTPAALPSATPNLQPTTTNVPAVEKKPTSTAMPATPTATAAPTIGPTALPATASPDDVPYLDDRSDAAAVIESLFNAVNLHQYARAYAYWDDTPKRPDFQHFTAGYQDTASVSATLGTITGDAGAGQLYSLVPVTLIARTTAGDTQTFIGCYMLHLSQPAVQGTLPFQPWGIQSAQVTQVDNTANTIELLSQVCEANGQPVLPQPTARPNDISAARYLDSRTNPVELLQSLFNAINRQEYVRAYSYWQNNAQNLPSLDQFTQGYSTTQAVTLTFGTVTPDAGAGQIRYLVPTTLVAQQTDGTRQTFVGCYRLHISNPDIQADPPFKPLAIESANVKQVPNDADTGALMNQMCGMP